MTPTIEQTATPRPRGLLAIDPGLEALFRSKGYHHSFQNENDMMLDLMAQEGVVPLKPETLSEWDPKLYEQLLDGADGHLRIHIRDGFIRKGDAVLCIQSAADRDRMMDEVGERNRRQQFAIGPDGNEELAAKLEELGIEVPVKGRKSVSVSEQVNVSKAPAKRGPGRPRKETT